VVLPISFNRCPLHPAKYSEAAVIGKKSLVQSFVVREDGQGMAGERGDMAFRNGGKVASIVCINEMGS